MQRSTRDGTNFVAKWRIVEDGTAVNFDYVQQIHVVKSAKVAGVANRDFGVIADNYIVESGFETENEAKTALKRFVDDLEGNARSGDRFVKTAAGRSAFPGVDNV